MTLETPADIQARDPFALVYERDYPTTVDRLWALWTEPEQVARWFGPETVTSELTEWAFESGGSYALVMNGIHHLSGRFEAISAPERLVMTWQWKDDAHASKVDVRFADLGDGNARMTMIHHGFESAEEQSNHDQGWTSTWVSLDEAVAA